ncbi:MAG: TRAP transporter small permease [Deltaproteobacteria bacterium]|nr:TRAP transporter small permease [Deltaproteobacteria bacterium]
MAEQKDSPLMRTHGVVYMVGKWISYVGMAMTLLMMLMVVMDVFLRFAFNQPILGSVELASYMLSIIAFTAIPFVESEEGHIVIPLVFDRFPKKVRLFVNTLISALGVGLLALIALGSFILVTEYLDRGKCSQVLSIPLYPFVFIGAVCISLYAAALIVNTIKYISLNR